MLELIFQGFIEWLYSLTLDCWNWLSSSLLDIMSLDLAYIKSHVPIMTDIMQVFLAVGWALLLGNLVLQAMKGIEAEDPKMLFGRSAIFSFLLMASPQLCELVLDMTSKIIVLLELPNAVNVHLVDASLLGNLLAGWLVVIICNNIIMWKVLKLLLKIAEQYVVLSTLTIAAPLAFSMGGSRSTVSIFTGWCRMYGSMCLLMVSNVMFFKMLLSVMSAIPSGLDVIPWMVLIFSIVKVAKRMDDTITRIGLNPAMTGAPGGRSLPGVLAASVMHGVVYQDHWRSNRRRCWKRSRERGWRHGGNRCEGRGWSGDGGSRNCRHGFERAGFHPSSRRREKYVSDLQQPAEYAAEHTPAGTRPAGNGTAGIFSAEQRCSEWRKYF